MTAPRSGSNAYHLALFGALSVVCGLLVAGLVLPYAALSGNLVKASANSLQSLPAELEIGPQSERSKVLMADGSTLAEFFSENRVYVKLDQIAPIMRTAQLAIEDSRFYEHGAIDFRGTARALVRSASGSTQGGSTLTQQYVKQVQVEAAQASNDQDAVERAREQTIARKVRELRYAVAVERKLSKDQILERYMNIAYYGDGAYGVEAAARHYFGTTAAKLNLSQAAMLAGLVQNPEATNPARHPVSALNRRNVVLNRMVQLGKITPAQAAAAKKPGFDKSKIQPARNGCVTSEFPTLCLYVRKVLLSDQFAVLGKTPEERDNRLKRGGLTIRTLIDPKAQAAAEKAVHRRIAPTDPFISTAVLIQPKTGLIVAMAQNRNKLGDKPGETWYNYAAPASLGGAEGYQAGSTFKTFTIAAALANGISPYRQYNSPSPMEFGGETFKSCDGYFTAGPYAPKNSTGEGTFNMIDAAKKSINTYFIQLERDAGLCDTVKMTQAAGVKLANGKDMIKDEHMDQIVSFTLGSVEVTPLSMAEGYATFANRGVHCDPIIVESITTKAGKKMNAPSANCKKVMEPEVADGVNRILQKVIGPGGTALPARLLDDRPQAGKTGTIDSAAAVWLAGYTPDMAGVAMIAVDKMSDTYKGRSRQSLQGHYSHGTDCNGGCYMDGSGGRDAGKIWRGAMTAALENVEPSSFAESGDKDAEAELPDISGKSLEDARAAVEEKGFATEVIYQKSSQPYGTYLYSYPSSGKYPTSRTIYFYVSGGRGQDASPSPSQSPR